MKTRYCMYCGMPIPHNAKICPECGSSLNITPLNRRREKKQNYNKQPTVKKVRSNPDELQRARKIALRIGLIFPFVFFAAVFCFIRAARMIENARSRHRENQMDAERIEKEKRHPHISIPDFSMPDFSFPDIQLPEPPPAEFSVEGYELGTNLTGETVLLVNVSYTNKAETAQCFLMHYRISVQQNGEECPQTAVDPQRENHLVDLVEPDETVQITEAFLISTETEAAVSLRAFFDKNPYLEETVVPHDDGTVTAGEQDADS